MVVAIDEVWCHSHTQCMVAVSGKSCSKCSSADVGVEKEKIWRSVSVWINQLITKPNYLSALTRHEGGSCRGCGDLFMHSRQRGLLVALRHALVQADALLCGTGTDLIIMLC